MERKEAVGASARRPETGPARLVLTSSLAVIATVALMVAGQDGAATVVRVTAAVVAVIAGATSLVTGRRKGDLVGWYVIAAALLVVRLLRG